MVGDDECLRVMDCWGKLMVGKEKLGMMDGGGMGPVGASDRSGLAVKRGRWRSDTGSRFGRGWPGIVRFYGQRDHPTSEKQVK